MSAYYERPYGPLIDPYGPGQGPCCGEMNGCSQVYGYPHSAHPSHQHRQHIGVTFDATSAVVAPSVHDLANAQPYSNTALHAYGSSSYGLARGYAYPAFVTPSQAIPSAGRSVHGCVHANDLVSAGQGIGLHLPFQQVSSLPSWPTTVLPLPVQNNGAYEMQHHQWSTYAQVRQMEHTSIVPDAADSTAPSSDNGMCLRSSYFEADHSSFAKPPHRGSLVGRLYSQEERVPAQAGPIVGEQSVQAQIDVDTEVQVQTSESPKLIAPGASAIPPPPPIEKSAHPLSALATDIVWEAFLAAANSNSSSNPVSPVQAVWSSERYRSQTTRSVHADVALLSLRHTGSSAPSSGSTPSAKVISPYVNRGGNDRVRSSSAGMDSAGNPHANVYGAIGGERKPRLSNGENIESDASSPASTTLDTPDFEGPANWMISTQDSGYGFSSDEETGSDRHLVSFTTKEYGQQSLRRSSLLHQQVFNAFVNSPTPPMALFEQIQKFLAATLLSQQVLLLALYFVARLPHTSPLYPPTPSTSALKSTSAPFKLLLAALVVANKQLDDNSFRNSTFATVSDITLPEINALEYSLLSGLSFDINIDTDTWLAWLRDLEHQRVTCFVSNQAPVAFMITPLIQSVLAQQQEQAISREAQRHPTSLSSTLVSSPFVWHSDWMMQDASVVPASPCSNDSMANALDLDAAGPLEQRPRYSPDFFNLPYTSTAFQQQPFEYSRWSVPISA